MTMDKKSTTIIEDVYISYYRQNHIKVDFPLYTSLFKGWTSLPGKLPGSNPGSVVQVYVDLVRMLDLRLGTSGGGANAGITFYDAWQAWWRFVQKQTGFWVTKNHTPILGDQPKTVVL